MHNDCVLDRREKLVNRREQSPPPPGVNTFGKRETIVYTIMRVYIYTYYSLSACVGACVPVEYIFYTVYTIYNI